MGGSELRARQESPGPMNRRDRMERRHRWRVHGQAARPSSTSCSRTASRKAWRARPGEARPLLKLRLHDSIADALPILGEPRSSAAFFAGFRSISTSRARRRRRPGRHMRDWSEEEPGLGWPLALPALKCTDCGTLLV